jgi:GNAT superfamily N-acetyltransferase
MHIETSLDALRDYERVQNIWRSAFGAKFSLTPKLWRQSTELDPNFRDADLLFAVTDPGGTAGFVLLKHYREDEPAMEKYATRGEIATIAVLPEFGRQGIGSQLLLAAEEKLKNEGVQKITVGANFRHFFPGLPLGYEPARRFFEKHGYVFDDNNPEYDLDGALSPELFEPVLKNVKNISYRQAKMGEDASVLAFLQRVFPGRWHVETQVYLLQGGDINTLTLAITENEQIVGFLRTDTPDNWLSVQPGRYWLQDRNDWGAIGPLGIHPDTRGTGAGLGLVAAGMKHLYQKGLRYARIDWTTLTAFYGKLGFTPSITYLPGAKNLA